MLRHALAQATAADVGPVELCAAPDATIPPCGLPPPRAPPADRAGPGRPRRAHAPRSGALPDASDRALLIGTDAPALDAGLLRQAALALQHHDAVFVPALDGGYALVGLRRADPRWFTGMHLEPCRRDGRHARAAARRRRAGPSCRRWPTSTSRPTCAPAARLA
jgi:hypothetical protein